MMCVLILYAKCLNLFIHSKHILHILMHIFILKISEFYQRKKIVKVFLYEIDHYKVKLKAGNDKRNFFYFFTNKN